jgi:hypothetical protein
VIAQREQCCGAFVAPMLRLLYVTSMTGTSAWLTTRRAIDPNNSPLDPIPWVPMRIAAQTHLLRVFGNGPDT